MYQYLDKQELIKGYLVVRMQSETRIEAYKSILSFGELVEYQGDVPTDWEYDTENDVLYSKSEKPSPFHKKIKGEWQVVDKDGFRKFCQKKIDDIKAEILEYGFDYEIGGVKHRQRCREKDITYMGTTMSFLIGAKLVGQEETTDWYFEDSFHHTMNLESLMMFATFGKTFLDGVYKAENYFKTLEEPKIVTKEEYLQKIQEFQVLKLQALRR
ncbi:hypothetical protein EPT55_06105 [Fusobacterium necrophorum]|uniref:hypothetical protein n=1 Tax=Fusobacterium necrophorum TaxID=859 RepID=UPI001012FA71|nr:hypothetical protein [Fusobacterium necrophorum]RXZ27348.1 hypothetical protein EPT55_06105 [Fusobacterium necrophorum]